MKSLYLVSALFVFLSGTARTQTTVSGSFEHGGITRSYSFYVPASYTPGEPVPLVLNLHGLGTDGAYQAQYRDFRPIADTAGFIVVHPDGSTLFGQRFWNYGNVFGSTVDDVGFLETLIDTIAAGYAINPQRIYAAGMSNGSFMCYYLACRSDRFAAIGAVTGSMSADMYDACAPDHPVPVIHVHGTDDSVNPYEGTSTMQGIADVIGFWVEQNGCDTVPVISSLPDINTPDNATATRYVYSGGTNGNTVELFKVTGGGHSWPGSPVPGSSENTCMDFDACIELWRFFSRNEPGGTTSIAEQNPPEPDIWPNPASGIVHVRANGGHTITGISIRDMQGRLVEQQTDAAIQSLDVRHLETGNYVVTLSGDGFSVPKKLSIL
jgi:polyhydroxybutyrate depolymerase